MGCKKFNFEKKCRFVINGVMLLWGRWGKIDVLIIMYNYKKNILLKRVKIILIDYILNWKSFLKL